MNRQELVEKWSKKRDRCWSLPVSVFADAVVFDNFFRCMCCFYSRQLITESGFVQRYFRCNNKAYTYPLATTEQIKKSSVGEGYTVNLSREIYLHVFESEIVCYIFSEQDMAWAREEYEGWSFLPYDMDNVLMKIAYLQAGCLNLPKVITQLIAQFAKEQLTIKDHKNNKDDGDFDDDRSFKIRTKRKHLDAITKARKPQGQW